MTRLSQRTRSLRPITLRLQQQLSCFPHSSVRHSSTITKTSRLPDWSLETFRSQAFEPAIPSCFPTRSASVLPAIRKWFIHYSDDHENPSAHEARYSTLRQSFWSQYESLIVPLEITTSSTFHRSDAPLEILLTYLDQRARRPSPADDSEVHSIYLAQCDLSSLPKTLQDDLVVPDIVLKAGKGDVYASSLWLGCSPTYTSLHRDPNPNLFFQLAGEKVIRIFPPEIGQAIFEDVQEQMGSRNSARFRGEEMMAGQEKEILHDIVWGQKNESVLHWATEARLGYGEALFIPKGWWHSVKGVGDGVVGSVNWWFR